MLARHPTHRIIVFYRARAGIVFGIAVIVVLDLDCVAIGHGPARAFERHCLT